MRRRTSIAAAIAVTALTAGAVLAASSGAGDIRDDQAPSDKITVSVQELSAAATGHAYEAWLVSDDGATKLSLGMVTPDNNANATLEYVSPDGTNLIGAFNQLVITNEPSPDSDPAASDDVVASDTIPAGALVHIRHLAAVWSSAPDGTGLSTGTLSQSQTAAMHAGLAKEMADAGNLAGAKQHAEHIINIIVGSASSEFGDHDGNGTAQNPGDGYGLAVYATGANQHAGLAAASADADTEVTVHGQHVVDTTANVMTWADVLKGQARDILAAADVAAAQTAATAAAATGTQILEGVDANGNGSVQPIPGEGGAMIAYEHSQLMAQFNLVFVESGAATPTASPAPSTPAPTTPTPATGGTTLPATGGASGAPVGLIAGLVVLIAGAAGVFAMRWRARARA